MKTSLFEGQNNNLTKTVLLYLERKNTNISQIYKLNSTPVKTAAATDF